MREQVMARLIAALADAGIHPAPMADDDYLVALEAQDDDLDTPQPRAIPPVALAGLECIRAALAK